jgi:heat shock protein HslJ
VTVPLPVTLGLLTVALVAACSQTGEQPGQPAALPGTSWILTAVATDGGLRPSVGDGASLDFGSDEALAGSTGCNRFTGGWSADGDRLTIAPGATTRMACPGELGVQESAVLAALAATDRYRSDGATLSLLDERGAVLAQYRAAVDALPGTAWRATGVNNGRGGVVLEPGTADLTVTFAADGTVAGCDGCGGFQGTFTADDTRISIDAPVSAPCPDPRQAAYRAALENATTWRVDGNRLELRNDAGALQVSFAQT